MTEHNPDTYAMMVQSLVDRWVSTDKQLVKQQALNKKINKFVKELKRNQRYHIEELNLNAQRVIAKLRSRGSTNLTETDVKEVLQYVQEAERVDVDEVKMHEHLVALGAPDNSQIERTYFEEQKEKQKAKQDFEKKVIAALLKHDLKEFEKELTDEDKKKARDEVEQRNVT